MSAAVLVLRDFTASCSILTRRLLRQTQEEKIGLESKLGVLARTVQDLQEQLSEAGRLAEAEGGQEEQEDALEVSLAVAATGEPAQLSNAQGMHNIR